MSWAWLDGQDRWRGTDVLRLAAAASVPVVAVTYGTAAGLALALVLGGCMLLRFVDLPGPVDLAGQACFLASGWWAAARTFERVPHLDLVSHAGCGLVLGVLVVRLTGAAGPTYGQVLRTVLLVLVLGVVWELGELAGHRWLAERIEVGGLDTVGDLVADTLGGLVGATWGLARPPRRLGQVWRRSG
ncbi:hypothetical protein [Arsenicicoccus dermatophilus]|uniref:hypothetical protein n=1 Tax=Arsenicicoccus dermatophilus TaxID=1076331 RepID=UPI003916DBB3